MNEAGLSACLSFGGRTVCGTGFGIPLVLRYVLETAQDTDEAVRVLERVPVSMCYSVTLLDAAGQWATVFVAPDRPTEVTRRVAVNNFQKKVEWAQHANATHSVERLSSLHAHLDSGGSAQSVADALLKPPLYQSSWERGYGTLYSAAYRPRSGRIALFWPGQQWLQSLADFSEGERRIQYRK